MDILTILFIIMLIVPAILLVAQISGEFKERRGGGDRIRVQQRAAAIRRQRIEQRRHEVESQVDKSSPQFHESKQPHLSRAAVPPLEARDETQTSDTFLSKDSN